MDGETQSTGPQFVVVPNVVGNPEYEARLACICPQIGKPCIREQCKNWVMVTLNVPNPLAPQYPNPQNFYRCQHDHLAHLQQETANMMMMLVQIMGQGRGLPMIDPKKLKH